MFTRTDSYSPPTPSTETVSLRSLSFSDRELEREFRRDYFTRTIGQVRIGLVLGLFLYVTFGILDARVIPDARQAAWFIRYVLVCPLLVVVIALSFGSHFSRYWQTAVILTGYAAGVGIVAMCALAEAPGSYLYYAGLLLSTMFYFTFFQLRFFAATRLAWMVFITYEAIALWIAPIPVVVLISNSFFFVSFILTGMAVSYTLERYRRLDFLQRMTIHKQTEQLQGALAEIDARRAQAEEAAMHDPLTGLFNRRSLFSHRLKTLNHYAILLLDLDHFKKINDTYGHATGDEVLSAIGRVIQEEIRETDTAYRYGGEEFAVLLPHTELQAAEAAGMRLLQSIRDLRIQTRQAEITVTVSIGLAIANDHNWSDRGAVIEHADRALYAAKQAGRNRLEVYSSPA